MKTMFALLCCIVFTLTVGLAAAQASETKDTADKSAGSTTSRPAGAAKSDAGKKECADKQKDVKKDGSEEAVIIPPSAPIVPRIAPQEGC